MNFELMHALYGRQRNRPAILDQLPPECRKVITRSTAHVISKFTSFKSRRIHPCESELEFDQATLLEYDPSVVAFSAQPAWLNIRVGGELRRHCPDFLVIRKSGEREYIEVKSDQYAATPEVQVTAVASKFYCKQIGYSYRLETTSSIKVEPKLTNAQLMLRNQTQPLSKDRRFQILARFGEEPMTVAQYINETGLTLGLAKADLLHLAAWEHLSFDWALPLGPETVFKLPE